MYSKKDLKAFFVKSCQGARFTKFSFVSVENFNIELKCQVAVDLTTEQYDQYLREWLKKFSTFTATTWIVRSSFAKLKRLVYRKIYTCSRSGFNKTKKPDFETRNQECKAKIDFRIKFINRNTIKNDVHLKEGLNLTISIDFNHTHLVRAPEAYNLLRHSSEVDEVFQKYFDSGCSTTAAKSYHEMTLIDKHGDNCPEVFHNVTVNPTLRHLAYLLNKKRKKIDRVPGYNDLMRTKQETLREHEIELFYCAEKDVSIIITPVMKRVISDIGTEHILIDSTDIPHGPTVTFILVPTKIGALPIVCIINSNKDNLNDSLDMAKTQLEVQTGETFTPKVCLLSNFEDQSSWSLLEQCKKYSSLYTISSEIWRLINNDESKVDKKKRHGLMVAIKTLLQSESIDTADKIYTDLKENETLNTSPLVIEWLNNLWDRRDQWLVESSCNMNSNLVEMSIRFLKEFLIKKCKSFPIPLMIDVVTNILENYYKRILVNYAKKTNDTAMYTRYLEKSEIVMIFGSNVRRISANEFRLDVHIKPKKYHFNFRTDTMCCDCPCGKKGAFCEHLTAIINKVDCEIMRPPVLNEDDLILFTKMAGSEFQDDVKPEINYANDTEDYNKDTDKVSESSDDIQTNEDQLDTLSVASSKSEGKNVYVDVKVEHQDHYDPLQEGTEGIDQMEYILNAQNDINLNEANSNISPDMKIKYETTLKALNDEFRRLNRCFSENPNVTNLATMGDLARELSKIRPVQSVDLGNMQIKLNQNRKRKHKD